MVIMIQTTPTESTAIARRPDPAGPLAVATPTTRKLADASISVNTRRAYAGALARLDAWRGTAFRRQEVMRPRGERQFARRHVRHDLVVRGASDPFVAGQTTQPGVEADRAIARIANGALAHMGITSERERGIHDGNS